MRRSRAIRWLAIAGMILLAVGLLMSGIAQFGHRILGMGFDRTVFHRYVVSDDIEVDDATRQQELSPVISTSERRNDEKMGLFVKTITYGSPYNIWFTVLSAQSDARSLRVESAELRFSDGSRKALEFVPVSPRERDGTESFTEYYRDPRQTRAKFVTAGRVDIPMNATIQVEVEYTVEMMDGTVIQGTTHGTLEYYYGESSGFAIPID